MNPLLRLRWKQVLGIANYWLRLVDYDTSDRDVMNRAYGVYLLVFFSWWTVAMWAIAANFMSDIGRALPPSAQDTFLMIAPAGLFVGQIVLLVQALRSSPLKLSTPDISYVAGSPVRRAIPAALGFAGAVVLPLVVAIAAVSFLAVALAQAAPGDVALWAALWSVIGVIPMVILAWGAAWVIGLLRVAIPGIRRRRWAWLAPVPLLALLWVVPDLVTAPGRSLALTMLGRQEGLEWAAPMAIAAAIVTAGVVLVGDRANLIAVVAESALHARLKEIGNLRWLAPSAYLRAKRQMQSATRRATLRLPEASGLRSLAGRAALAYIRDPLSLLKLGFAVALVLSGLWMLAYQAPLLLIVAWLYGVAVMPTGSLVRVFHADVDEPFLRQFLPVDPLRLLIADAAFPTLLVILASTIVWLLLPVPLAASVTGIAVIVVLSFLLALSRGASLIQITLWQARVSHGVLSVICLGLTVGAGLLSSSMLVAVLAGTMVISVLASLVQGSRG